MAALGVVLMCVFGGTAGGLIGVYRTRELDDYAVTLNGALGLAFGAYAGTALGAILFV